MPGRVPDINYYSLLVGMHLPRSSEGRQVIQFCKDYRVQVLAHMTTVVSEIADDQGYETLFQFVRGHGGRKIYVCHDHPKFNNKYDLDISLRAHDTLVRFSDTKGFVEIPSIIGLFMSLRRVAIQETLKAGQDLDDTRQKFGATDRHLRDTVRLLNKRETDRSKNTAGVISRASD